MEIIENAIVDKDGAYYESGGLIYGTPRFPQDHKIKYWQQENKDIPLAKDFDDNESHYKCNLKYNKKIDKAIYVGRLSTHLGHFILESLPKLSEAIMLDYPIIGKMEYNKSKNKSVKHSNKNIKWLFKTSTNNNFFNIESDEIYMINKLFLPQRPILLSESCSEPWKMKSIINKIVIAARKRHKKIKNVDHLYLKRFNEDVINFNNYTISNPKEHISKQIAMISRAKNLYGIMGTNTHLSIFSQSITNCKWDKRGDFIERMRNQVICDLIKTFNEF